MSNPKEVNVVISIFVVRFDTHGGNLVEKCFPEDLDVSGVEFKSIASGFHSIEHDVVYFRKGPYYGISVYGKRNVGTEERGARMKAVGVLSRGYETLHLHIPFLKEQVQKVLLDEYSYDPLTSYLDSQRNLQNPEHDSLLTSDVPKLQIATPLGHFSQFALFFGPSIFSLWKFILLKARILFYSPPPLEVSCYRVYSACLLGSHRIPVAFEVKSEPLFFVEVNDINVMGTLTSFVACTSEKIFEMKKNLYDVFVDRRVIMASQEYGLISRLNRADEEKWAELEAKLKNSPHGAGEIVQEYFLKLTTNLFSILSEVSLSPSKEITPEDLAKCRLHPEDTWFLKKLLKAYDLELTIQENTSSFGSLFSCCVDTVGGSGYERIPE